MLLARFLERGVQEGTLHLIDAAGRKWSFGRGRPTVAVRLHHPRLHWRLALQPELALGEAYTDALLTIEHGTLYELLEILARNKGRLDAHPWCRARRAFGMALRRLEQWNPVPRARDRVAHHYDLSDSLYAAFLDRDRQYSCAYFAHGDEDLERAQEAKKRHIAAKLLLDRPGLSILDIGSGWGGLALYLARMSDAEVHGLTLSDEQLAVARRRADEAELPGRVRFSLRDYRNETGRYDRIVSVGMFEHVGVGHYREFFRQLRSLMADDGVALVHSIGRMLPPGASNPWLSKYIFPGGYTPALSEVLQAVELSGLWVTDIEILRIHYAETLRRWNERFQAHRTEVAALYDERFCRMWEFYLQSCEIAFRHLGQMVFQIQLARRQDAVPLKRDYINEFERQLERRPRAAA